MSQRFMIHVTAEDYFHHKGVEFTLLRDRPTPQATFSLEEVKVLQEWFSRWPHPQREPTQEDEELRLLEEKLFGPSFFSQEPIDPPTGLTFSTVTVEPHEDIDQINEAFAYISDGEKYCWDFYRHLGFPLPGNFFGYCYLGASKDGPLVRNPSLGLFKLAIHEDGVKVVRRPVF